MALADAQPVEQGFELGEFQVRPQDRLVVGPDSETRLEPKSMAVLLHLARARGQTVLRDHLIEAVWPRGHVTDDVLTRCIAQIRKALGDNSRNPRFVLTIPKQGYRLAGVQKLAKPASSADSLPELPGLLVLPFQSLSANSKDAYIADGLTELLIASLASVRNVRLISRTSAMTLGRSEGTLPELARRVGARWVVEGSVLIAGDQIQVVAQLIEAETDAHLWADKYQRELKQLLSLQNEVAEQIALQVHGELRAPTYIDTLSNEALRQYLRGITLKSRRTTTDLQEARVVFESLTEEQPAFAPAWSHLAEVYKLLAHYGAEPVAQVLPAAHRCVQKALEIDRDEPVGLACLGGLKLLFGWDHAGAEVLLRRALRLQPNHDFALINMANICSTRGRFSESRAWCSQAIRNDPLNVGVNMNYGDHLILGRTFDEAVVQLRRTLDLAPDHLPTQLRYAWALALAEDSQAAQRLLDELRPEHEEMPAFQEYAAIVSGLTDCVGAMAWFERLRQSAAYVTPWAMARAAAAAGEIDQAFELLSEATDQRSSSVLFLAVTPAFDSLRNDQRWEAALKRVAPAASLTALV